MATTLSRNLRLRLNSNLTADALYNLQRLDALAAVFNLDNTANTVIRSSADIVFQAQDASIGGAGVGGAFQFGSASQPAASVSFYATSVGLGSAAALNDAATGGTKTLSLVYDSSLSGTVDNVANRALRFDLDGADRQLVLGGNYKQTGGNLTLALTGPVVWTMPAANSVGVLSNNGTGTLSWNTAGSGSVTSIDISAAAPLSSSGGPITTSGTIALGFQNQIANYILAGPTSGPASSPAFRALAAVDMQLIPGYRAMSQTWTSGASLTITHNWGTRKIMVEVLDGDNNYREVFADDESRPTDSTVVIVANVAPTNWLVLLKEVP